MSGPHPAWCSVPHVGRSWPAASCSVREETVARDRVPDGKTRNRGNKIERPRWRKGTRNESSLLAHGLCAFHFSNHPSSSCRKLPAGCQLLLRAGVSGAGIENKGVRPGERRYSLYGIAGFGAGPDGKKESLEQSSSGVET